MDYTIPFIDYLKEDKSRYKTAREAGYYDPYDNFLIGDSGGFLLNMNYNDRFINTDLYREPAICFTKNKYYTPFKKDTTEYDNFRVEEERKRREGITKPCLIRNGKLIDCHISGKFYGYLNYNQIKITKEDSIVESLRGKSGKKVRDFPSFLDSDFWKFAIKEFIINNSYHLCGAKARRKGWSYTEAWDVADEVNMNKNTIAMLLAYQDKYLFEGTAITVMAKNALSFLETNTPFKRGILSTNMRDGLELGYKKKDSQLKQGYQSKILSFTAFSNPSAGVGQDAAVVKYEECGIFANIKQSLDVMLSSTEDGSISVGNITCFGTGGHEGADWFEFADIFYNPEGYGMMPFENVWDDNMRHTMCGYFHPNVFGYIGCIDNHGNTVWDAAINKDVKDKEHAKKTKKDLSRLTIYIGQRANKPSEAFSQGNNNIFYSPEFAGHFQKLISDNNYKFYRDGMVHSIDDGDGKRLKFYTNDELATKKLDWHPYIIDVPFKQDSDLYGCVREYFPPVRIDGRIPDNLYRVWFDPVHVDKKEGEITVKHSLNSFHVYMRPNNFTDSKGDIIVAAYAGRPLLTSEASEIVAKVALYYNAKIVFERGASSVKADFIRMKLLNLLELEPTNIIEGNSNKRQRDYGINISGDQKIKGIKYLREMMYKERGFDHNSNIIRNFDYFYDIPTNKELLNYRLDRNFDRVSSLIIGMFDRIEDLTVDIKINARQVNNKKTKFFRRELY